MRLRDMTPAQRELARRKLAQAKGSPSPVALELDDDTGRKLGVKAGFRAGKRRKGNSLLKQPPTTTVTNYTRLDVRDEAGNRVATMNHWKYWRNTK